MEQDAEGVRTRKLDYNTILGKCIDMDAIIRDSSVNSCSWRWSVSYLCYFLAIILLNKLFPAGSNVFPYGMPRFDSIRGLVTKV